MYTIIICIVIGLIESVWSASNKICITGAPMTTNKGIQGEYTYGGTDSDGNDYWYMHVGSNCIMPAKDNLYVRYSNYFKRWEISFKLKNLCYYYECDKDTTLPSECGHNNWIGRSGIINDFYILDGECPSSQSKSTC